MRRGASKCRGVFLEIRRLLLALLVGDLHCCIRQRDGYVTAVRVKSPEINTCKKMAVGDSPEGYSGTFITLP